MPALVAGIHVLNACPLQKTWMAGTSPAMTATMLASDVCERTVGRYFCKFREAGIRRGDNGGLPEVKSPDAYGRAKRCVLGPKIGRFRNRELSPLRSPCRRRHLPLGSRSSGDSSYGGAGSCFGTHSPNNRLGTNSAASAKNDGF
jgi:hypothetical protein